MSETTTQFRAAAVAAAVASWALVAVGGVVRATESGLGCPDWPLCEGRAVPAADKTPLLEFSHRATALLVTSLVTLVAVLAWRRHRARRDLLVPALVALGLVPFQAVLGAVVVWLELPGWIVGLHFVVGMVFLAATVAVAAASYGDGEPATTAGFVRLARWLLGTCFALVVAGAAVVSLDADGACGTEWPLCNGSLAAGGGDAVVQAAHRLLAYAVVALAIAVADQAWRGRGPRLLGTLPLAAVAAQLGFGIALVLAGESGAHGPLEALHVAGAGAVWGVAVALAVSARATSEARPPAAAIVTPARGT